MPMNESDEVSLWDAQASTLIMRLIDVVEKEYQRGFVDGLQRGKLGA